MGELLGQTKRSESLCELIDDISSRILEVSHFRGLVGFQKAEFNPTKPFVSQYLSFVIPDLIKNYFSDIEKNINFILLVDEFENFSISQQKMLNTLIKFVRPGLTFRIGMRRNGWRTFGTVNDDDFIKEGRDYEKFIFEEILHSKRSGYKDFLVEVARKRLESVDIYKKNGMTGIENFLGNKEDLEAEALTIVKGNPRKIDQFFKSKFPSLSQVELLPNESPLVRMLGFLWIARGVSVIDTQNAIIDYESGKKDKSELAKKLQFDLVDKYRLSLTIILASIYRTQKLYYSFNTFSYLSSGIVGHFIELCRYTFRYAEFDSEKGYIEGLITPELQGKASIDVGMDQLQQIRRIEEHGKSALSHC